MGVHVTKPSIIYADNLSEIIYNKEPGSALKQKHVALSYHFCREHYSSGVIDKRKVDGKHKYAGPFNQGLVSKEFHGYMGELLEN